MCAVSVSHRQPVRAPDAGDAEIHSTSPPANRPRRSRWRDPRLWLGALLVLASVVIGAKVLAAADDTVAVWVLDRDVGDGMSASGSDVRTARVHFSAAADANRYWLASDPLPAAAHFTRDIGAGELLARSAISTDTALVPHQLPLAVTGAGLAGDVSVGDHVEVWAVPKPEEVKSSPTLVLSDVTVMSVGDAVVGGLGSDRQVVVALPEPEETSAVLDALNGATVVLVRISG